MTRQRGTQIVELALCLPLLLFLLLLSIEGAAVVRAHQVMTNAAREGARAATLKQNEVMLEDSTQTFISDTVTCYMARNKLKPITTLPSVCNVSSPPVPDCVSGTYSTTHTQVNVTVGALIMPAVQVQVSCNYRLNYFPYMPWFGSYASIPLKSTVVWRRLY